jgi:hypothetical protein
VFPAPASDSHRYVPTAEATRTPTPSERTRSATETGAAALETARPTSTRSCTKQCYLAEHRSNRLNQSRGIATRYDKTADSSPAALTRASLLMPVGHSDDRS